MVRTYLVIGSSSEIGALVCAKLECLENRVIRIDARGGDIKADFTTPSGRFELAEKVTEFTDGNIDSIIFTSVTHLNKPVAISNNYFGITQFIEALNDELKKSSLPRVSILNYFDQTSEISEELLSAILHSNEKKALKIAQQILETTPSLAYQNYATSQKAIQKWVTESAQKRFQRKKKILINAVTFDQAVNLSEVADLLIWLASPTNQNHSGEILNTNALLELSTAL